MSKQNRQILMAYNIYYINNTAAQWSRACLGKCLSLLKMHIIYHCESLPAPLLHCMIFGDFFICIKKFFFCQTDALRCQKKKHIHNRLDWCIIASVFGQWLPPLNKLRNRHILGLIKCREILRKIDPFLTSGRRKRMSIQSGWVLWYNLGVVYHMR